MGTPAKPTVGSLFAGVGGFDLGFHRAGFDVSWCVEIDPKARAILARHFPNARIFSDIRDADPSELGSVDVVCGGFPCQDLSVAGKRAGLAGARSGLFYEAMRIIRGVRPKFVVVENVAGLLSSNHGHDFSAVLRERGEGWDCSEAGWRVLGSRYFGVAQRRRRVFIIGARTGFEHVQQILDFPEGGVGNAATRGEARKETESTIGDGIAPFVCWWNGTQTADTLTTRGHCQFMPDKGNFSAVICNANDSTSGPRMVVRRLTPTECERLQGFPDGWTDGQSDADRYKQIGNAVTVNVAQFIATRINEWVTQQPLCRLQ